MPTRQSDIVKTPYTDVPSDVLLLQLHEAKSKKDTPVAEVIAKEFQIRDMHMVNRSIFSTCTFGQSERIPMPAEAIVQPESSKGLRLVPKKRKAAGGCTKHCFCMLQQSMFSGISETTLCCRCGKEKGA